MKLRTKQKNLTKNIANLSIVVRKLSLYTNFIASNKTIDKEYVEKEVKKIKFYIENIEKYL